MKGIDTMLLEERKLNEYVRDLSLEYFGKPYDSNVSYNGRLKKVAGRCFVESGRIELATVYSKYCDDEEFKDTVLHELVHYHLYRAGYIQEHHGANFKALAKKVGASRYAQHIPIKYYNHVEVTCEDCGNKFYQYKAFNENDYVCSKCKGRLHCKHVKAVR